MQFETAYYQRPNHVVCSERIAGTYAILRAYRTDEPHNMYGRRYEIRVKNRPPEAFPVIEDSMWACHYGNWEHPDGIEGCETCVHDFWYNVGNGAFDTHWLPNDEIEIKVRALGYRVACERTFE